jgi:predicted alpha/beta-fold hydrolase
MVGLGVSLGAAVLSNYIAKEKDGCPLTAAVCIGCHFDSELALETLTSWGYGLYDYVLGTFCRINATHAVRQIDILNMKISPEKVISEEIKRIYRLSKFVEKVVVKVEGFKSFQIYNYESSCTHRFTDIKIPLFFLSANDDPIIGSTHIPIEKCTDNVLIGVTKAGGHLGYF